MALVRRDRFEFPEIFRRFFDAEFDPSWLRVEEFMDGDTLVVRAKSPGWHQPCRRGGHRG